jgi:predicted O-methyltransferase YrrM
MVEALPDDGVLVACEVDPDVAALARECFAAAPGGEKIDVRVAPAGDTLAALAGQVFDLVFVDADKAGYLGYVRTLLDTGLLATGGLICVDNTLLQGEPYLDGSSSPNGDAIAAFNQAVADDPGAIHTTLTRLKEAGLRAKIIAYAANPSSHRIVKAMSAGAADFLHWPCDAANIIAAATAATALPAL